MKSVKLPSLAESLVGMDQLNNVVNSFRQLPRLSEILNEDQSVMDHYPSYLLPPPQQIEEEPQQQQQQELYNPLPTTTTTITPYHQQYQNQNFNHQNSNHQNLSVKLAPMFVVQLVLFPYESIKLHVYEPRYLQVKRKKISKIKLIQFFKFSNFNIQNSNEFKFKKFSY